jgi:two-component system CheB/CheR fusion protein
LGKLLILLAGGRLELAAGVAGDRVRMANDDASEFGSSGGQQSPAPVVVGIGASAGGVQALQSLFAALPSNTGAAFVVVVHLDPQSPSEMANILATRTSMPVKQVDQPERLQADHVYVIPPDRRLSITNHEIAASEFVEPRGHRSPIDLFFRSLAEQYGDGCAVVLTGAGTDGGVGIRAVKEAGGIILVQDPIEAEYPSMPRNAIATGVADFVLPVKEIAAQLIDLVKDKEGLSISDVVNFNEDALRRILAHVRVRTGHDFTKYKRATVVRRIARRMQVTRTDDPAEYYNFLKDNPDEASALFTDLLISVTTFFRDAEVFEALKREVIPHLFVNRDQDQQVRVWVAGCATGEEAYSISMLLLEEASRHEIRPTIQIFGSDLDARALAFARDGRFPAAIEADVSEERLRRFFLREGDEYRVRQEVRDTVLFASHSVLKDPPFSHIDLVSCRNLLIYLDRELQQQVCSTLHYALNPGGYLLLGSSETAENPPGLFRTVDRKARIYQSTAQSGDKPRLLPRLLGNIGIARDQGLPVRGVAPPSSVLSEAASHRKAIEKLAPPSILVDSTHRAIHLSENAGRYLQPSGGPLSGDIVDLVRPELRFELRSALHRFFEKPEPSLSLPILVRFNGAQHRVLLHVRPAFEENDDVRNAVVLFIEGAGEEEAVEASHDADRLVTTNDVVRRLTEELQLTQARLRTTREESEITNEELRAANEELQSINEEYRSTSEELETSKEELQSINEELQTVNSELKLKLEAVSRAHSDLQNLMAATDFGTLFLDSALRIKRFTQPVTELFSVTPSDEGRPITDFAHRLEYHDLVKDAQAVISHLSPLKREVRGRAGRWYDVRLRPYRTVDNKIDGVVITFVDITELKQVEKALRDSETLAQQEKRLIDLSRDPIFVWDYDGGIREWNRGCEELYGYSSQEALGKDKEALLGTTVPRSSFANLRKELLENGSWNGELAQRTKDGRAIIVESRIVLETIEGRRLALECTRDITERKAWEVRQQMLLGELTHRVKNTLTVVQSIAHQSFRSARSREEFIEQFDGRLSALASAHGLLVESDWKGADLGALVSHQLEAYVAKNRSRLAIIGEPLSLPADLATPFGLVFHELATNAAKHGSLSRPTGKIRLHWTLNTRNKPRTLTVVWQELDGPRPKAPNRVGFGTALIENGIPNATVKREFPPDGLICTITVPMPD